MTHQLHIAVSAAKGRGAWAWRSVGPDGRFEDGSGIDPLAGAYRLRLHAFLNGLTSLPTQAPVTVRTTDPTLVQLVEEWMPAWRAKGFRKPSRDRDLVLPLGEQLDGRSVVFELLTTRTGDFHAKDCSKNAKKVAATIDVAAVAPRSVTVRGDVEVVAWTDGGSRKNPGPSGWGCVLVHRSTGTTLLKRGGLDPSTNNQMELTAIAEALDAFKRPAVIELRTDSTFSIQCCTTWMAGWKRRGWRKADGEPPANLTILQRLDPLLQRHDVHFTWVKGHAGEPGNELADQLCNIAIDHVVAGTDPSGDERSSAAPFPIVFGAP